MSTAMSRPTYADLSESPALRRLLKCFGSQQQVAEAVGVSKQAVSLWMKGQRLPSVETCIRIEQATDGKVRGRHFRPRAFRR